MTDTFISYSRKDIAFVKIIHEALQNNQLETWIDWQDIPPSADWFSEIEEAIEQADTFIFIISESSLNSKVCNQEILHAEKNNKRMIPIVINDIAPEKVPASLQSLNWIFFKEENQAYKNALEALMTAITLDQPWLKAHTRLQNRALEYIRHDNEKGFLLYGADLAEAEQWLTQASGKDPEPTTIQTQYIVTSRAQATRRQRYTLAAVMFGFVVAVILGILAWNQRNVAVDESQMRATAQIKAEYAESTAVQETFARSTQQAIAVEQKGIAEDQRNIAEARQLAALSLNYLDSELDVALLLSVEGERKDSNYLTQGSILTTLQQDPSLMRQFHGQNVISILKYSPDGKYFISSGDKNIRFWDPVSGTMIGEPIIGHTNVVNDVAINHAGTLLASASDDGTIKLWNLPGKELLATFLNNSILNSPESIQFSADDKFFFSFTEKGDIWVWDANTLDGVTPGQTPMNLNSNISDILICPDSQTLISAGEKTESWNLFTGEKIADLEGETIIDLELSPDQKSIAGFDDNNLIFYLWDASSFKLLKKLTIAKTSTNYADTDIEFHPTMDWVFLINRDRIEYIDLNNSEKINLIKTLGEPEFTTRKNLLSFSPDGKYYVYGGTSAIIQLRNTFVSNNQSDPFNNYPGKGFGLDISNDGKLLAITGNDDDKPVIHIWDIEHFDYLRQIPVQIYIKPRRFNYDVIFHPDGFVIFSGYEDEIRFYDPETAQLIGKPLSSGDDVQAIALSPDGNLLAVEHSMDADENLQFWNLETHQKIGVMELNAENHLEYQYVLGIEFSPDGKTLAAGLNGGFIIFWDLETFKLIGDPIIVSKNISPIKSLTYSPDGKMIASGSDEGIIQLWDVETRYSIGVPMTVQRGDITDLLFNSSGTTLYSSDDKGEINIWDVASQQPIGLPITRTNSRQLSLNLDENDPIFGHNGHQTGINTMILSKDDSILLSMDQDGVIRTWNLNFEYLAEKACLRAGRNLTQNEWYRFLPNEAYRMTCPLFTPFYTKELSGSSVVSSNEYVTRIRDVDNMVQVFVPAGEFEMGSRTWTDNGDPFMLITLDDYWIDQTEVTNRQYAVCEKSGNCTRPSSNSSATRISSYYDNEFFFDYPVIYVSMQQAEDYCKWAGGRIPTEAEWEKAARGTEGFDYPWGNSDPKSTFANFHDLIGDTTKTGSFPLGISPYGALDMAGNVSEWTKDAYEYKIDKSDVPDKIRGGAWNMGFVYTWMHENAFTGYYFYDIGFRCISDH